MSDAENPSIHPTGSIADLRARHEATRASMLAQADKTGGCHASVEKLAALREIGDGIGGATIDDLPEDRRIPALVVAAELGHHSFVFADYAADPQRFRAIFDCLNRTPGSILFARGNLACLYFSPPAPKPIPAPPAMNFGGGLN